MGCLLSKRLEQPYRVLIIARSFGGGPANPERMISRFSKATVDVVGSGHAKHMLYTNAYDVLLIPKRSYDLCTHLDTVGRLPKLVICYEE